MQQNNGGMMQNMKLIHSKRRAKLKFLHSFMLFLSAACILIILFCILCIVFKLLSRVVCIFLPYAISATFGLMLYLFLIPLHEAGHFYTSFYYMKKYNIPAKVYIKRSMTISAEWENFGYDRSVNILKNGSRVKVGYCIIMFFLILFSGHIKSGIALLFTAVFEYSLNCTPIRKGNDYDLIQNIEKFYGEKNYVNKHRDSLEKLNKMRIVVWGILWQIDIIMLSLIVLILLSRNQFEIIEVLKNFIMAYCYGK